MALSRTHARIRQRSVPHCPLPLQERAGGGGGLSGHRCESYVSWSQALLAWVRGLAEAISLQVGRVTLLALRGATQQLEWLSHRWPCSHAGAMHPSHPSSTSPTPAAAHAPLPSIPAPPNPALWGPTLPPPRAHPPLTPAPTLPQPHSHPSFTHPSLHPGAERHGL